MARNFIMPFPLDTRKEYLGYGLTLRQIVPGTGITFHTYYNWDVRNERYISHGSTILEFLRNIAQKESDSIVRLDLIRPGIFLYTLRNRKYSNILNKSRTGGVWPASIMFELDMIDRLKDENLEPNIIKAFSEVTLDSGPAEQESWLKNIMNSIQEPVKIVDAYIKTKELTAKGSKEAGMNLDV